MTGSFLCIGHVPEDTSRPDDMTLLTGRLNALVSNIPAA